MIGNQTGDGRDDLARMTPRVSVLVPCYNERRTIGLLLKAIWNQSYPRADIEVIIADGMSTDGTRDVIESFTLEHPKLNVRVIDNPDRIIPAALNRAVEAASGEVLLRMDAHAVPDENYVEQSVRTLQATGAANVGGLWRIAPSGSGWMARAIAAAASHPLGAGDARYRTSGAAGPVDTVPFGAFPLAWIARVGRFDERLLTNEDYEFNLRLRNAGGVVWFDPAIQSVYYARPNLTQLARQYARYGFWKARMIRRYPRSIRWRQVLPPLFVGMLLLLILLSVPFSMARTLLTVCAGGYFGVLVVAGLLQALTRRDPTQLLGLPLSLATMHLSWGASFLWGLVSPKGGS
jgi:succinoglycan biosynthesis protein ExoA